MTTDSPTPTPGPESEPKRELAISRDSESRELVVTGLRGVPGIKLGLSVARLARYVTEYRLDQGQVDQVLALRQEYGAGIPAIMAYYAKGVDLDTLNELYAARQSIIDDHGDLGGHGGLTVAQLHRLRRAFGLGDYNPEDVANLVASAHKEVSKKQKWIKYGSQTVTLLLEVARSFKEITLDGAIRMIASGVPDKDDLREVDPMETDDD